MRQTKKVLAILLLLTSLLLIFTACFGNANQLKGTYASISNFGFEEDDEKPSEEKDGTFYAFSGNKVTVTVRALGIILNEDTVTYRISDDKITFTSDSISYVTRVLDMSTGKYTSTYDFEMREDGIKIGGKFYKKL